jgi:hypothetical protein
MSQVIRTTGVRHAIFGLALAGLGISSPLKQLTIRCRRWITQMAPLGGGGAASFMSDELTRTDAKLFTAFDVR